MKRSRHGRSRTAEYRCWRGAKDRCYNENSVKYPRYGGRGITMCPEWHHSFEAFMRDMGPRPAGYSIDRIDNDGNYEPGNVRWATVKEQSLNKSSNIQLTFEGSTRTIKEWADVLGMRSHSLRERIQKLGWSTEKALTTPIRIYRHRG